MVFKLFDNVMNAKDTVSASLAECYVTIDGSRLRLMQLINIEARMKKKKTEVPIMGKTGKGNKAAGWSGTGMPSGNYHLHV